VKKSGFANILSLTLLKVMAKATGTDGWGGGWIYVFLASIIAGSDWSATFPRPLYPKEIDSSTH
jgi:hypothetical protein